MIFLRTLEVCGVFVKLKYLEAVRSVYTFTRSLTLAVGTLGLGSAAALSVLTSSSSATGEILSCTPSSFTYAQISRCGWSRFTSCARQLNGAEEALSGL